MASTTIQEGKRNESQEKSVAWQVEILTFQAKCEVLIFGSKDGVLLLWFSTWAAVNKNNTANEF